MLSLPNPQGVFEDYNVQESPIMEDGLAALHPEIKTYWGRRVDQPDTTLLLANTAGPFLATSPNTAVTYQGGSTQTITWNPANTDQAPVNTANVKISLSVDGGYTYPYVLAESTANDGSEPVTLPNVGSTQARIKIEAVGNIFFDISNTNFTIQALPVATNSLMGISCSSHRPGKVPTPWNRYWEVATWSCIKIHHR